MSPSGPHTFRSITCRRGISLIPCIHMTAEPCLLEEQKLRIHTGPIERLSRTPRKFRTSRQKCCTIAARWGGGTSRSTWMKFFAATFTTAWGRGLEDPLWIPPTCRLHRTCCENWRGPKQPAKARAGHTRRGLKQISLVEFVGSARRTRGTEPKKLSAAAQTVKLEATNLL